MARHCPTGRSHRRGHSLSWHYILVEAEYKALAGVILADVLALNWACGWLNK